MKKTADLLLKMVMCSLPALLAFTACSGSGGSGVGDPCGPGSSCPEMQECVDGVCLMQINCIDSNQCDMSRPFCDPNLGRCVASCVPACTGRCCGDDGCGGQCPDQCAATGQTCDGASCNCQGQCQPRSCESYGYQCGIWPGGDGCGGDLQCPSCPQGLSCNISGQCVEQCIPQTCQSLGYQCGIWPGGDGCGGDLQCPACSGNLVCNGSGQCVANCTPQTCQELGYQCGFWPEGDGCSGDLQCPACSAGWSCDQAGQCVEDCYPITCQDLEYECGFYSQGDGCGGDLSCGQCDSHSSCDDQGQCQTICDLDALDQDQVINLNLTTVNITGTITINGQTMPNDTGNDEDRGYVIFLDKQTGANTWLPIGPAGQATFSGLLFGGLYDVYFETNTYQDNDLIPDGKVLIGRDMDCTFDQNFQWNLAVVNTNGTISLNGSTMPNDTGNDEDRGYVIFTNKDTSSSSWLAVGPAGTASISGTMFGGHYSVTWETNTYQDNDQIPDGKAVLEDDLHLTTDLQRNWNLQSFQISGQIQLNGQTMPNDTGSDEDRGYVIIVDKQTGTSTWYPVGPAGPATYSGQVFAGEKTLFFETNTYQDNVQIPDGKVVLTDSLLLDSNLTRNFDLPVITLSGQVTLNQTTMPNDTGNDEDRGYLIWRYTQTGYDSWVAVGAAGPANYSMTLFGGVYSVYFETNTYQDNNQIPDGRKRLVQDLEFQSSQQQNWNLNTVNLQGTLTMNGAQMPNDTGNDEDRGYLTFKDRTTNSSTWLTIGPSGPASWSGYLFAGLYDVRFETNTYQDNNAIPDGPVVVETQADCQSSGTHNWDLKAVTVSGVVSHNSATMGNDQGADEDRGYVIFGDMNTGRSNWAAVGPSGQAAYSISLWGGTYNVQFETNTYAEVALPDSQTRLLRGCLTGGSCDQDPSDLSGTWDITFLNTSWNPDGFMVIDIVHDGDTISGTYSSEQSYIGSGSISGGMLNGSYLSFHVDFAQTGDVHLTGTLANGCFISGHADVSGGLDSDFIAEKR